MLRDRLRTWAKKLSLLLVTTVIVLAALEIGVRWFGGFPPSMYRDDPVLGKIYRSNLELEAYMWECDCVVPLRFNRDGLRGEDWPYEKPPGVRRVALLGDSMIAALETREEYTTAGVLATLLNRRDGTAMWEVLNFGVAGSSTGQELAMYRERVRRYDPDVVVNTFFTGNDFSDNSRRLSSSRHRVYFDLVDGELRQVPRSAGRARFTTWLGRNSRFYLWQKDKVRGLRTRVETAQAKLDNADLVFWREPEGDAEHAWQLLEHLLRALHREVREDGSRLVVAALPTSVQLLDDLWESRMALAGDLRDAMDRRFPERRLGEICARVGVPLVEMLDAFRAASPHHTLERRDEWLHYGGAGHFNDAGNRLAAELLDRFLADFLDLGGPETPSPRAVAASRTMSGDSPSGLP